jgi:hypothetical protein
VNNHLCKRRTVALYGIVFRQVERPLDEIGAEERAPQADYQKPDSSGAAQCGASGLTHNRGTTSVPLAYPQVKRNLSLRLSF